MRTAPDPATDGPTGGGTEGRGRLSGRTLVAIFVALALLVVVACLAMFYREPVAIQRWLTRQALDRHLDEASLDTPAGRLAYWRGGSSSGAGGGSVVVLLHGAGDDAGSWGPVTAALVDEHRVLVPDLPGHGDSEPATGPIRPGAGVDALAALLAAEAPDGGVVLVGHSLGARVALATASREEGPVIERLVLLAFPPPGTPPRTDAPSRLPTNRDEARRLVRALAGASQPEPPGFVLDDLVEQNREGPLPRLADDPGFDRAVADALARLATGEPRVPVDLVWGDEDGIVPLGRGEELAGALPGARLHVLEGCAHVPHLTCVPRVARRLLGILGGRVEGPPLETVGDGRAGESLTPTTAPEDIAPDDDAPES